MPYRVDVPGAGDEALDRLVELGAIDAEALPDGGLSALMPDHVGLERVESALGVRDLTASPAVGRDAESVWVLRPRPIHIGRLRLLPAHLAPEPGAIRLLDRAAFGTGLHPTTALCLEALQDIVESSIPEDVLDVGTGSGVLALAALRLGVPHALGIDLEDEALRVARENARLNGLDDGLELRRGGPDTVEGRYPLVLANVLAAPLIEMAFALASRVGRHGHLVLSGIPSSVEPDVDRAYRRVGLRRRDAKSRGGWVALVFQASF